MPESLLLVHDDLRATASLRKLLGKEGYEVELATSVPDAIAACAERKPTLILLAPAVDGGQGKQLLETLPKPGPRVVLLGEAVPGLVAPVAAPPYEGPALLEAVKTELGKAPPEVPPPADAFASPPPPAHLATPERETVLLAEVETLRNALTATLKRIEETEGELESARKEADQLKKEAALLAEAAHGAETDHADSRLALERSEQALRESREEAARLKAELEESRAAREAALRSLNEARAAPRPEGIRPPPLPRRTGWLKSNGPASEQPPVAAASGEGVALDPSLQRRLEEKARQAEEADYFTFLELQERPATRDEVVAAYQRLKAEFHPLKYAGSDDPAHWDGAERIAEALEEAAEALLDDRLRREYAKALVPGCSAD